MQELLLELKNAGINTLIAMGTVFIILAFISFIIYLFKYLNFDNEKKFIKEEKIEDDLVLVAIITAAIAESENISKDSFVVRSIKKKNKKSY